MRITGNEKWRTANRGMLCGRRWNADRTRWEFWYWSGGYWSVSTQEPYENKADKDVLLSYDDTWCEPHGDFGA